MISKQSKYKSKSKKSSSLPRVKRGELQTMEELLAEYGGVRGFSQGDEVRGKVIAKELNKLVIDIGGKSEGIVAEKAYKEAENFIKTLQIGDEVTARVIIPETPDGFVILSLRAAAGKAFWEKLLKAKEEKLELTGEVKGINPSGVIIDVNGILGFIPNSQLGKEASKNKASLIGKRLKALVIEVDRGSNKIILSEKAVSEAGDMELVRKALETIKEGEIYEGIVTSIYDFGFFVKIDVPVEKKSSKGRSAIGREIASLEGLVHISEMSWEKVDDPKKFVTEGDKVKVKVISIKDSKLALSIKQTLKDPWEKAVEKYKEDAKVKGKVVKVSDFGAFVALEPGIEGLVHMTKIPPGMRFSEGDEANVYVEEIDAKTRKISLGLVLTTKPVGYK